MKKEESEVRYRMFCLVPYNISEIQKGIQALHGVVEYQLEHGRHKPYKEWKKIHYGTNMPKGAIESGNDFPTSLNQILWKTN
jgi:hypothetical protein